MSDKKSKKKKLVHTTCVQTVVTAGRRLEGTHNLVGRL